MKKQKQKKTKINLAQSKQPNKNLARLMMQTKTYRKQSHENRESRLHKSGNVIPIYICFDFTPKE
jgi:hypothetical protein